MGLLIEGRESRQTLLGARVEKFDKPRELIVTERPYVPSEHFVATDPQYIPSKLTTKRFWNPDSATQPDDVKTGMLVGALTVNLGDRALVTDIDTRGDTSTQVVQTDEGPIPLLISGKSGEPIIVNRRLFDSITGVSNLALGSWGPDAVMTQHLRGNRPGFREVPPEEVAHHMQAEAELMRGFREDGHTALVGMNEGWSLIHKGARSVLRFPHKQVVRYPDDARVNTMRASDVIEINNKRNPDDGISRLLAQRLQGFVDDVLLPQFPHGGISVATDSALVMVLPKFTPKDYGQMDMQGRNIFFENFFRPLSRAVEAQLALQHSTVLNSDLHDARVFLDTTYQTRAIDWNRHDQLYDKRSPFSWRPFDPQTAERLGAFYDQDQIRYPAAYSLGMLFTDEGAIVAVDTKILRGEGGPVELMLGATLDRSSSHRDDAKMKERVATFYKPRVESAYALAS